MSLSTVTVLSFMSTQRVDWWMPSEVTHQLYSCGTVTSASVNTKLNGTPMGLEQWVIDLFLAGVIIGFLACLCIVAFWDNFHAWREVKREERKSQLRSSSPTNRR